MRKIALVPICGDSTRLLDFIFRKQVTTETKVITMSKGKRTVKGKDAVESPQRDVTETQRSPGRRDI